MRLVFMGTPQIAAVSLQALIDAGHEIAGVFTQPNRPVGRKGVLTPPPVKVVANAHHIPVFQPEKIKEPAWVEQLKALQPEAVAVVAFGQILSQAVLDVPKYGCINLHGSLLPALRGAAPIQWSIINGLAQTGMTTMRMDKGIDTGAILLQKTCPIDKTDTAGSLFEKLGVMGAALLCQTIEQLPQLTPIPQEHDKATYAPMLSKEMARLDFNRPAKELECLIRGCDPWPVAQTMLGGRHLKIYSAKVLDEATALAPGSVICDNTLCIACGSGILEITQLQPEGKKRMTAADFLRGCPVKKGTVLGN